MSECEPEALTAAQSLAASSLATLRTLFASIGHIPSSAQWDAISDLLAHLEAAALGELDPTAAYVSAIPAGTGKTTSIQAFARALTTFPEHSDTGMLIAVNRKQEARDMAEALADIRGSLCVICSEADVIALGGHTTAEGAQVVISTQAALKETLRRNPNFALATRYRFKQRKRAVVVWDESLAFNRPVVLDNDAVVGLAGTLGKQSGAARTALLQWNIAVADHPGGVCDVPDFEALGVDLSQLEQDAPTDELASQAKGLAVISGGRGWVHRDNRKKSTAVVTHYPEIPSSLLPVIVTDASAAEGVNAVAYEQMGRTKKIVRLKAPPKTYENLSVRVVPVAASRSAYRGENGKELVDMAVAYVRSVAPDPVLVISYKAKMSLGGLRGRQSIAEAINAKLNKTERERVSHLHWGAHQSSNAFRNHEHVLLTGLNFLPPSAAYASSAAALDMTMASASSTDHPDPSQVADMARGMLRDSTLQALLRGQARLSYRGDCLPMEAVIFQSRQSGLSDCELSGMFPGARITDDHSLLSRKPLRGKLAKLSEIVMARIETGANEMTDLDLMETAGLAKGNYGKLKKKPEWKAWLTMNGFTQAKLLKGLLGIRRVIKTS